MNRQEQFDFSKLNKLASKLKPIRMSEYHRWLDKVARDVE